MEFAAKYIAYEHFAATSETVLQSFIVVNKEVETTQKTVKKQKFKVPFARKSENTKK